MAGILIPLDDCPVLQKNCVVVIVVVVVVVVVLKFVVADV